MNKERRNRIEKVIESLEAAKAELEEIQSDEQSALDNVAENLQQSENAQKMEECADELSTAADDIDTVISSLQDICNK